MELSLFITINEIFRWYTIIKKRVNASAQIIPQIPSSHKSRFRQKAFETANVRENTIVKKSLEFDYPPPKVVAFRQIHGFATVISKAFSGKAFSTLPHAEHVVF